jgi:large subunit ribosomal protein L13
MHRQTHNLDATDQSLGRLASQIVILLRGKNKPDFTPNIDTGDFVCVENIKKIKITGNTKMDEKKYYQHSGYPGGLKAISLKELISTKGEAEALKKAVWNMLPKNKLRSGMIKRLTIN